MNYKLRIILTDHNLLYKKGYNEPLSLTPATVPLYYRIFAPPAVYTQNRWV